MARAVDAASLYITVLDRKQKFRNASQRWRQSITASG